MSFSNDKAIYLQMADRIADRILNGEFLADQRIPSVREYAVSLGVNANTAVKAYDSLAQDGIIYNRRGLGYFVAENAADRIRQSRRKAFFHDALPEVFRQMRLLDISITEVDKHWADYSAAKEQQANNDKL